MRQGRDGPSPPRIQHCRRILDRPRCCSIRFPRTIQTQFARPRAGRVFLLLRPQPLTRFPPAVLFAPSVTLGSERNLGTPQPRKIPELRPWQSGRSAKRKKSENEPNLNRAANRLSARGRTTSAPRRSAGGRSRALSRSPSSSGRGDPFQQVRCGGGHLVHGSVKGGLIRLGRLAESAHLANELQGRRADLFLGDRWRIGTAKKFDGPAHRASRSVRRAPDSW